MDAPTLTHLVETILTTARVEYERRELQTSSPTAGHRSLTT
jgi:hypothetical protein